MPKELVAALGTAKIVSLKTKDLELARLRRDAQWLEWDEEYARARRSTITLPAMPDVLAAIETYLSNMVAIFNWAIKEDWLERNPAAGLIDPDEPVVERRAFSREELEKVFGALQAERDAKSWRFWSGPGAL